MIRTPPQRLAVGVALAVVLVLLAAVVAHQNLTRFILVAEDAQRTNDMLAALHKSFSAVQDAETGQRGFLLTGDDRFLEPYLQALQALGTHLYDLRRLAAVRPEYGSQVGPYEAAIDAELDYLERNIALARTAGFEVARQVVAAGEGKARMDAIRRLAAGLEAAALERLAADREATATSTRRAVTTIGLASTINLALLAGLLVLFRRYARDRAQAEAAIGALNRDLAAHAREVELANVEMETFSYSVSHDLRAPLRSIDGFSRILEEEAAGRLPAEGVDALARIRAACARMARLIDALLSLSRLTRRELRARPVDLAALARSVVADLAPELDGRAVQVDVAPEMPAHGDPDLLRVVLANLVGNAVKFTRERTPARIAVGTSTLPGGETAYFVRDNGAGFDMAYADKLFRPFERLTAEVEGTGIGLATVERVIARHGGRVWAEGAPEAGATFWFTLGR